MVQSIPMIPSAWIAQLAPIELVEQLEPVGAEPVTRFLVMMVVIMIVGVVIAGFWLMKRRRAPELDRAFHAMAHRLKLGKRRTHLVGQLADAGGVPAVVLLLSEHAFDLAVGALEPVLAHAAVPLAARTPSRHRSPELSQAALASLKRSLFGDQ